MNTYEIETLSAMKRGAVTLCLGSSTGANIKGSLQVADEIARVIKRGKVLYLNTIQTKRQISDGFRKMLGLKIKESAKPNDQIHCITTTVGHLANFEDAVVKSLQTGVRFVIINSLEFSSKDYRRRDDLIFQILEWTNIFGVGVLVFAEASKTPPRPGKIQRGGAAGKLAAIARSIIRTIEPEEEYLAQANQAKDEEEERLEDELESIQEEDIPFILGTASLEEIWKEEEKIDPSWKPKDLAEEVKITEAWMLNHPEFKKKKGETWLDRRMRILILIDRAKKRKQALIDSHADQESNIHKEEELAVEKG